MAVGNAAAARSLVSMFGRHLWTLGLVSLAASVGCDLSGQYEKRFAEALQSAGTRARFDKQLFDAATSVKDAKQTATGVQVRLPKFIDKDSKSLPATDARAQPPFLALPGLDFAYERQLDDGNNQNFLPTYVYFAAVPKMDDKKVETKGDALQASLAKQLAAAFPGAAWSDVQLPTPDGKTVTLKRIRCEGPQDFVNLQTNKVQKTDGRFDLYFIDSPAHHVLIGWRSPKVQGEKYFYADSELAMGTLSTGG
jgi:hypothetical protein